MSTDARTEGDTSTVVYNEPGRTYVSSVALGVLIVAGFVVDLVIGGGRSHLIGWIVAFVLVVGFDALVVHAARTFRTVVVTDARVSTGEQFVARDHVAGLEAEPPDASPVLGRQGRPGAQGLPRNVPGLALRLVDGSTVIVPTRHPDRLADVLRLESVQPDVRPADDDELALLPEIEHRSGVLFELAGLHLPDGASSVEELRAAPAVFVAGRPAVGFVQLEIVDGSAHIKQISVLPGHMRRGIGTALIEAACAWARARGDRTVTLTTFTDVSFNGPYYAGRHFTVLDPPGPELAAIRRAEADAGLDAIAPRQAMIRSLGAPD